MHGGTEEKMTPHSVLPSALEDVPTEKGEKTMMSIKELLYRQDAAYRGSYSSILSTGCSESSPCDG